MKMKDIGEHEFISKIVSKYISSNPYSDVYVQDNIALKIDGFPLKYSFPFMDSYDLGWKAVVATLSDLISFGSIPVTVLVSIGVNPEIEISEVENMLKGINDACAYYNAKFGGGDTNSANGSGWIDVSAYGVLSCKERPVPVPGDLVYMTGEIGLTTMVFMELLYKNVGVLPKESVDRIRHPVIPRPLIKANEELCETVSVSSDVSDGLLITLHKLTKLTNLGMELWKIPLATVAEEFMSSKGLPLEELLRVSGEEYETVFLVKKESEPLFTHIMKKWGIRVTKIGKLVESPLIRLGNKEIEVHGWDNFKGWF
ncbi:thiamine monophosphate kinase [Metallosphaera yellowstonensis MK1]|uniref:Thiamine-monophosphate kinase n=1 Tax=Metallosphaera yellowstonensis MK1 TaxID=671065 RepID=H2C6U6_9CREN|nr:AIR synthase related protein [Metallosphaera yellowstonensis]EHP69523.1 thiamine monophosphate kinase [Metallosphaera yellowstonensis MK1]